MATSQDFVNWVCTAAIDYRYLKYVLLAEQEAFLRFASGTTHQTIYFPEVKAFHVRLPPVEEQRAIADILGSLDDKIELNRHMNQTLEATATTLFKAWFLDFEPVYARMEGREPVSAPPAMASLFPQSLEASDSRLVPSGWRVRSLDSIAEFLNGLAMQKYPPTGHDDLPVIKIADLRRGNTDGGDLAGPTFDPRCVVGDGDILFSWSGTLEVRLWTGGRGALNQHLFKVTPRNCPQWFVYYWLLEHLPAFRAIAADKATTMGHIQRHHLTAAKAIVPEESVLHAAHDIIAPLVRRAVSGNLESRALRDLRDTLLPKLLSGEVRVSEAESTVGAAV